MTEEDIPTAARLLRDFVNTREPQLDAESWATPEQLHRWLADHQLLSEDTTIEPADLATALEIREGLRALLIEHAGHERDDAAVEILNGALSRTPMVVAMQGAGYHLVSLEQTSLGPAVARLADAIRESCEDGTWLRLKACARDSCRWAFYDGSKNQVRRWCSMAGCGNHIKMQRAYRARKARAARSTS